MLGAMDAAEDGVVMLQAMPDDAHAAMRADGCERSDRAFERVEDECLPAHGDGEALVVLVAALHAFAHGVRLYHLGGLQRFQEPFQVWSVLN